MSKEFLNGETRVYMRVHTGEHVTSFILNRVHGTIEHRPGAKDDVIVALSGQTNLLGSHKLVSCDKKRSVSVIKKVYLNPPYTVVIWEDKTKTKIKCQDGDIYDPEKGLALAISKKALGNKGSWYEVFKKFISPSDPSKPSGAKYKVGDKVLIKKEIPNSKEYFWFDDLKGRVVTITEYDEQEPGELKYQFDGYWSPEDWIEKKVEE